MLHLLSPINLILLKENALFFTFVLGEFCYANYKICRNITFFSNNHHATNYNYLLNSSFQSRFQSNLISLNPLKQMFANLKNNNKRNQTKNIIWKPAIIYPINRHQNMRGTENTVSTKTIENIRHNPSKSAKIRENIPQIARWLYNIADYLAVPGEFTPVITNYKIDYPVSKFTVNLGKPGNSFYIISNPGGDPFYVLAARF